MKMRIWLVIYSLLAVAAAAQTTHYTVTDSGSIGAAPGQPFTVNTAGLVAGAAVRTDGTSHAMLWYKGTRMDLGTLGLRISNSLAFTVNDNGQVVGMADTFTTYPLPGGLLRLQVIRPSHVGNRVSSFRLAERRDDTAAHAGRLQRHGELDQQQRTDRGCV